MKQPEKYMQSTYKIIWSDEAYKNLLHIVDYLETIMLLNLPVRNKHFYDHYQRADNRD